MVKVKICGLTNLEDALIACELGADALGFIFYEKSPRYISPAAAREIMRQLPPFISKVGVVVNLAHAQLQEISKSLPLNMLQLHGDESPAYCAKVPLPYLKVFRVANTFRIQEMGEYAAKGFLLDTFSPDNYGGTGEAFDWTIAKKAAETHKVILSGGLTPRNVLRALDVVKPYAVDCCSGVEAKPGKKDPTKLAAFFNEVRKYGSMSV